MVVVVVVMMMTVRFAAAAAATAELGVPGVAFSLSWRVVGGGWAGSRRGFPSVSLIPRSD